MRQFLAPVSPDKNGLLEISGKDYHYLHRVLRIKPGDMITVRVPTGELDNMTVCLVDEAGGRIVMQICADAGNNNLVVRGVSAQKLDEPVSLEYWLFQFIARPQKMELIIRQAVECGVYRVIPVVGVYSQSGSVSAMKQCGSRSERFTRLIREAREQSGSPVETQINVPVTAAEAAALWRSECGTGAIEETAAVVLSERNDFTEPVHRVLSGYSEFKKVAIAVGCEGGISPDEMIILQNAGFVPVHFAGNILRCETAAVYGIAAVQTAVLERKIWAFKE